jgi:hypothetical protein
MQAEKIGRPPFEDYPYDPQYDGFTEAQLSAAIQSFRGLDRLRCIKNRALAKLLYELWWHVKDPSPQELQRERDEKEAEDLEHLESMTEKALDGVYGNESKRLAMTIVQPHRNAVTMRRLRLALQRVPGRISG